MGQWKRLPTDHSARERFPAGRDHRGRRKATPARQAPVLLGALALFLCGGCAATRDHLADGRVAYLHGDFSTAVAEFEEVGQRSSRWQRLAEMDAAMVQLAAGDPAAAERRLRAARDHFDTLPELAPLTEAASLMTDDRQRAYRAAGYEQVMLRTMLSLCSLAGDGVDAESYALQAHKRQAELAEQAEAKGIFQPDAFQPVAVATYVRGLLRESTHHDYDDAQRAYALVAQWQPAFGPASEDVRRAAAGVHSAPGHGVLYVFACVGRGPVRVERIAETTSDALRLASLAIDKASGDAAIPRISSVPIAEVIVPPSPAYGVGVRVRQGPAVATMPITDIGRLAVAQNQAERPYAIARAVLRRVAKESALKATSDALSLDGQAAGMLSFAAGSLWQSAEKADLRCWGLLPREIHVARLELPAGTHTVDLEVLNQQARPIGRPTPRRVSIVDGKNTYLIVFAPEDRIISAVSN